MSPAVLNSDSLCAETAAATIAYKSSDFVFSVQETFIKDTSFSKQLKNLKNLKTNSLASSSEQIPQIEILRASADPFLFVLSTAKQGNLVSVASSSEYLLPSISRISQLVNLPVVLHISVKNSHLNAFADIVSLRSLGFFIIQSTNTLEAQDLSIAAHAYSLITGKASIHFYIDSNSSSSIVSVSSNVLQDLIPFKNSQRKFIDTPYIHYSNNHSQSLLTTDNNDKESSSFGSTSETSSDSNVSIGKTQSPEDVITNIFEKIENILLRKYSFFEYHGSKTASNIFIVFGHYYNYFVDYLKNSSNPQFALLFVRVYRPLNYNALLDKIPSTIKSIAVIEQINDKSTKWNPLYLDLIYSTHLAKNNANSKSKLNFVTYSLKLLSQKTISKAVQEIILNLSKDKPVQGLVLGDDIPTKSQSSNINVSSSYSSLPSIENVYNKILNQLFTHLQIQNLSEGKEASTIKTYSPEFGLGKYISENKNKTGLQNTILKAVKSKEFSSETIQLLNNWLLSLNTHEKNDKLASEIKEAIKDIKSPLASSIRKNEKYLYNVTNWIIGSDAWAYDIGNSAVHHALSNDLNINILIIDSTPYSKRHAQDPNRRKKDIALYSMNYGNAYVGSIAAYSSYSQSLQVLLEASQFNGPSIVVAYLPYEKETDGPLSILSETKKAVDSGYWPLFSWNPKLDDERSFRLYSERIKTELKKFIDRENKLTELSRRLPKLAYSIEGSYETEVLNEKKRQARKAVLDLLNNLSGPPLTILFASDGGTAETVAKRLERRAKARGLKATVSAMDDYPFEDLPNEENVVFITSTAGQGEFPQNGRAFWDSLKQTLDLDLANVNITVFGLGDSHYWPRKEDKIFYNKPAKDLFNKLTIAGAKELIPLGLGDEHDPDAYQTVYNDWEPLLWKKLGVDSVEVEAEPAPLTNEDIKIQSNYLRGTIAEGLKDESTGAISASDQQLTKFHGIYMQDDRDIRDQRKAAGLEPAYSFMIRVRMPAGVSTPAQWLAIDDLSDATGNHTFKLTTRATYQLHGVLKRDLKNTIRDINHALLDTIAACGDVDRNVTCASLTTNNALHKELVEFSRAISEHLLPKTRAYHEIWLTDENDEKTMVAGDALVDQDEDFEPLYGKTYLPRKFKIAIAVPPDNDVDVYANDVGLIAITDKNGKLSGFNVLVGGGMGATHNNVKTYPRTGSLFGYVPKDKVIQTCEKIMLVQRDHGDRTNRKHARLKYTLDDMGIDTYRKKVEELLSFPFEPAKPFKFDSNVDKLGWSTDETGKHHFGMFIENGRIEDTPDFRMKTGLRELAKILSNDNEFRLTANQHVILSNITNEQLPTIKAHLQKYKLDNIQFSGLRLSSASCVALPTCGLAMAESERYLPLLITKLEEVLEEYGLRHDSIVMRMTGCPNGCARPYIAEIACVGKAPGAYNLLLGGGYHGERLNKVYKQSINEEEIISTLKPLFKRWSIERNDGEHFGDFLIRAGVIKATLSGKTFHDDVPEE